MCDICENNQLRKCFPKPDDYLACLDYIRGLIDSGDFDMESQTCDIDKVKNQNGCWADDIIEHTIKCKKCGQMFICSANTFRGGGSFETVTKA